MILPFGGYGALLSKLAGGLDIRLRTTVKGVHHSPTGVILDTSAGVVRGDAVVVTLPLGVLQLAPEEGGVLFNPPLPEPKQRAIRSLGFGTLNKVALFFDHPFWGHQTDFFGRVVPNPKQRGHFFLFFNLHPASGSPTLLALAAGAAAAELEGATDEQVTEHAVAALASMFGAAQVPPPLRTLVTRWGSDKYARGSYSYVHVGASGADYATLGEPVGERLHFAGEHTIMEHPATVVGAYLSGLRAGRAIHQRPKGRGARSAGGAAVEAPPPPPPGVMPPTASIAVKRAGPSAPSVLPAAKRAAPTATTSGVTSEEHAEPVTRDERGHRRSAVLAAAAATRDAQRARPSTRSPPVRRATPPARSADHSADHGHQTRGADRRGVRQFRARDSMSAAERASARRAAADE